MTVVSNTLEREITNLLQCQRGIYEQAWQLLEPASHHVSGTDDLDRLLMELNDLMDRAASNEAILRRRWHEWEEGQYVPSDLLRSSWQAAESQLKRLIERVEVATQRAQASRDAIVPSLVNGQAHHRMRAAYGRSE